MAIENRAKSLLQENEELKQRIQQLEFKISDLHQNINELNEDNDRTKERLKKTEVSKPSICGVCEEYEDYIKLEQQVPRN